MTSKSLQDYPSISFVNHLAKQHAVSVIWAVTAEKIGLYRSLTQMVEGSTAGVISNDSSNIVELIENQYKAITTNIDVSVKASSGCKVERVKALNCPDNDCSKVRITASIYTQND